MDNMLSQEEINALLDGINPDDQGAKEEQKLSEEEKDIIGEISNISMGAASTALSTLLNNRVSITTPQVTYSTWSELSDEYDKPCVFVQIYYKEGLAGSNILLIKDHDVKYIANLMMGGDGTSLEDEISDLLLSAISEAMNQMMGSAATSLSTLLNTKVDITPPTSKLIDLNDEIPDSEVATFLTGKFVRVSFNMKIGNEVDTNIMQLYPFEFAHDIYRKFLHSNSIEETTHTSVNNNQPAENNNNHPAENNNSQPVENNNKDLNNDKREDVKVQQALFQPLNSNQTNTSQSENINIIMDVPLEVRVELGRTHKSIKDILNFAPGTIIELDKLSGEPVDVLVNNKQVAQGEVVVIDESFGIRITEILNN